MPQWRCEILCRQINVLFFYFIFKKQNSSNSYEVFHFIQPFSQTPVVVVHKFYHFKKPHSIFASIEFWRSAFDNDSIHIFKMNCGSLCVSRRRRKKNQLRRTENENQTIVMWSRRKLFNIADTNRCLAKWILFSGHFTWIQTIQFCGICRENCKL